MNGPAPHKATLKELLQRANAALPEGYEIRFKPRVLRDPAPFAVHERGLPVTVRSAPLRFSTIDAAAIAAVRHAKEYSHG